MGREKPKREVESLSPFNSGLSLVGITLFKDSSSDNSVPVKELFHRSVRLSASCQPQSPLGWVGGAVSAGMSGRKQLGVGVDFFSLLPGRRRTRGGGLRGETGSDLVETFL